MRGVARKIISVITAVMVCFIAISWDKIALDSHAICCRKDGFDKSRYTLTGNMAEDVATIAKSQKGRFCADFGYSGVDEGAWCDEFVADCIENAGGDSSIVAHGGTVADFAKKMTDRGAVKVTTPQTGDLVFFTYSHVEIVTKVVDGVVYSAGGNNDDPDAGYTYHDNGCCKGEHIATSISYYLRPAYVNSNYDPDAPSSIEITGYDGPQKGDVLALGANCGLYGTIVSTHPLSKVWGGVYNRDGSKVGDYCYCSESTSVRSYSLRGTFNNSIIFDYLPEGFYTFKIEAADSKGYSKVVVDNNFQIGNPVVSYTVTLNANGGSVSPTSITVTANGTYSGLPNPSRTGYTFAGWYTAQTGGTKKENGSSLASNSNHTLYAHWTANPYTVAFHANGGSGSMGNQTLTYDQAANLTANAFSKTGYSFAGWNTKPDGSGTSYADKASVKNLATSGTVTLYAQWSAGRYTIAYHANGGSGSMSNQTLTYDQAANLTANAFSKTGYSFAGWNTKPDGSGTSYADKASVKNLATSGTVTLYAQWSAGRYTIAYHANGGSGSMGNQTLTYDQAANLTANAFSKTGYSFAGWNTKADGTGTSYADKVSVKNLAASGTVTLYARWTPNKYTVKFDGNGADELSKTSMEVTYDSTYGELPQPKRNGYNFIGWYTRAEGGTVISPDTKVTITEAQTLYAQWSQVKFLITFDATGGMAQAAQKLVTYDKAYGVLPTAERLGYTFKGWYLDKDCTQQITSETVVALTVNQLVYAKWEIRKYVIAFDATGGTSERDNKQVTYGKVYGVLPTAAKDGDEFIGWFTEDGIEVTSASVVEIESDITLYAKWVSDELVGDVNADGVLSMADVIMMQKWLLCAGELTDWQAGDLNADGRIDGVDFSLMKGILIEKEGN